MEREFYVYLEGLSIPDVIKQWYMDHVHQFPTRELAAMLHWTGEDFIRHYEYQDFKPNEFAKLTEDQIIKDIEKLAEYILLTEDQHYQECLNNGDAEDHIYLSAYNVFEWLRSKKK